MPQLGGPRSHSVHASRTSRDESGAPLVRVDGGAPRHGRGSRGHGGGHGRRMLGRARLVALAAAGVLVAAVLVVLLVPPVRDAVLAPLSGEAEATAEEDAETVLEEEEQLVPMNRAAAFSATTDDGLEVTAPDAFLEGDELDDVSSALDALEADGSEVAFVLEDMTTGRGIRYNDARRFYSASSIKVAVCTMILEENGNGAGYSPTIADALVNSSNDAFSTLVNAFGFQNVSSWLAAHSAPDAAVDASEHLYVDISATELANVWQEVWRYATSGEAGSEELGSYLSQTVHSPIGDTLRDACEVWSKPGWYPDDGYGLSASNDAGIVFSDTGDYVLVILTDIGDDTDALIPLIEALDAAHASMCGDELVEP